MKNKFQASGGDISGKMKGQKMDRIYLDWNATTPLRPEARAAMVAAMDVVGNPSSVHGEGWRAKGLIEKARRQVAQAFGADGTDVIFTASATEAAALALAAGDYICAGIEHEAIAAWSDEALGATKQGHVEVPLELRAKTCLQAANGETGIIMDIPAGLGLIDATQAFGKVPFAFNWSGAEMAIISAHKLGGPKGIGALIVKRGTEIAAQIKGGGQEMGRRAGTENVIGIAGFGAAAEAAAHDLDQKIGPKIEKLRNILENLIAHSEKDTIFVGNDANRLPNTSCFITPGWRGETQVMVMDLAGFAISAGSACSSGKVRASKVLRAMGYNEAEAGCAIRVSLGPTTTEDEVRHFANAWIAECKKWRDRAG